MALTAAIAIYEENQLPAEVSEAVARAVTVYLQSLPHAEEIRLEYEQFVENGSMELHESYNTVLRWSMIERQAKLIAEREAAALYPGARLRLSLDFTMQVQSPL